MRIVPTKLDVSRSRILFGILILGAIAILAVGIEIVLRDSSNLSDISNTPPLMPKEDYLQGELRIEGQPTLNNPVNLIFAFRPKRSYENWWILFEFQFDPSIQVLDSTTIPNSWFRKYPWSNISVIRFRMENLTQDKDYSFSVPIKLTEAPEKPNLGGFPAGYNIGVAVFKSFNESELSRPLEEINIFEHYYIAINGYAISLRENNVSELWKGIE